MQEDAGIPTVRVATRPQAALRSRNLNTKLKTHTRQYIDIQCDFCKMYGHKKVQCDKMATWLHLHKASQQLDEKLKTRILENYGKTTTDRRSRRLQKIKGTVRQLYTEGQTEQAEALWDKCMCPSSSAENSDDDRSTSSEE